MVFPRDMLLDSPLLSNALSAAVAAGIVTEDEARRADADQRAAAQAGTALAAVSLFAFVVRKT